jgi:hypothetical protein
LLFDLHQACEPTDQYYAAVAMSFDWRLAMPSKATEGRLIMLEAWLNLAENLLMHWEGEKN